ncbi:MAG: hypothetical protein JWM74_2921 [Myxococcaceae bacterium]|nr:hypothetical protein [Myxococcaceae bacterium]
MTTLRSFASVSLLLFTASLSCGCSRLFEEKKKDPASFDCSRVPSADIEAIVGPATKAPKESADKANGGRCRFQFKDNYVDVLAPPAPLFDAMAADKHMPLTGVHDPAFRKAEVSLTVDGLGDAAYLANANGVEFVLWVKKGTCVIALQSTIDPALHMDQYRKLAEAVLARKPCG